MTSKSNSIINAGEIIIIINTKENKVLINSTKQWLKFTLLEYNNVVLINIKNSIIIINKTLSYQIILILHNKWKIKKNRKVKIRK